MEKDLYLTEAPLQETPDTTILHQPQRVNIPKSLANPNDRRNQIGKKHLSSFLLESYYDDKKIKPGINFFKLIVETEDRRRQGDFKGPFLHMNMQTCSVFMDNSNSMIFCEKGVIKTENYISYEQYLEKLNENQSDSLTVEPFILSRCCNGITFENSIIMNNEVSSKILPRSQNVISAKFTTPFAMYPNIIKLFFIPKHVKTAKKNIAYKVINRKQMTEELFRRKHRLSNNFLVNVENEDSYIATLIKGKALQSCEFMAESLVEYIEQAALVSISEIVIDFVVDQNKTVWFSEICSVKSQNKTKLWEIGCEEQIQKMASENNNQIMCRLCGMLYTKKQMEKIVTNKLIYELSTHLQNRGNKIANIPHLKKEGLSNVCHLCYELIKAEHTLINVEREFSKLMNIRQNTIERVQSKETAKQTQLFFYDEEQFQALGQQTCKYKRWRLFFYIEKLKRIPGHDTVSENFDISLDMKFQNQKETFVRRVQNENYCAEDAMIKKWEKTAKSTQRKDSSRSSVMRVQSAMPHRQKFRSSEVTIVDNQENLIQTHEKNNKSYFNDQTTCITHSQSYFSNAGSHDESFNNTTSFYQNSRPLTGIDKNKSKNESSFSIFSKNKGPNSKSHFHHRNDLRKVNLQSLDEEEPYQQNDLWNQNEHSVNESTFNANQRGPNGSQLGESRFNQNGETLPNMKVDKVKMFVFYTKAHEHEGKNFLDDEELEFSLTFQNQRYEGKSSTLKNLKNKDSCQRHSSEVYLFDHGLKYCNLQLTVGMIGDGTVEDEGLDLEKRNNLFWGKTYSCEPLPDEWMEVFTNGEEVPTTNPEKILQNLKTNNFSTSPPKIFQRVNSVNYLERFEQNFIQPTDSSQLGSQSSSNLKKTSIARCKTAVQRRPMKFVNRMKENNLETVDLQESEKYLDI